MMMMMIDDTQREG